jgi:hypothetical protein
MSGQLSKGAPHVLGNPVCGSVGILETDLNGTIFSKYATLSKAYAQKDTCRVAILIKALTISKSVLFILSTAPFSWGVPSAVN